MWNPETGETEPASFRIHEDRTTVPLNLDPWGSIFVVFRKATASTNRRIPSGVTTELETLDGSWKIDFEPNRGAPSSILVDRLISWSDSSDVGVKYFSGTATYTRTFDAPAGWSAKDAQVLMDLGDVKNLAEVLVNGKSLGVVWHAPYRVNLTSALKPGTNDLVVKVTNAWVNRLIGDEQPGATRYTYADFKPYRADAPLLPSGLLGPVRLYSISSH